MSKVIDITQAKKSKTKKENTSDLDFEEIEKINKKKKEKLAKERLNSNKATLRSYRIKN